MTVRTLVEYSPSPSAGITTHADDAHRLLAELTDEPALMFGSSFGALLDTEITEFPGGHSLSTHPTAFTARLREVLRSS